MRSMCFQYVRLKKKRECESVGRVWQEQTDHKLVRHLVGDATRYQGAIRSNTRIGGARQCQLMDMEEEVDASVTVWGGLGLRLRLADPSFSLNLPFLSSLLCLLSQPTSLTC